MRCSVLLSSLVLMSAFGLDARAQYASNAVALARAKSAVVGKPVIASTPAIAGPQMAAGVQGQVLDGAAEQHRLKALAYLGLGRAQEAQREARRLVALVPGYAPHLHDPAAFAALIEEVRPPVITGSIAQRREGDK